MKKMIILLVFANLFLNAKSQYLNPSILKSYDAGVITRLYEVSRYTDLSLEQQKTLADHYTHTDSLVKVWLIQNRPFSQIDSLRGSGDKILYAILKKDQRKRYARNAGKEFAELAVPGELEYIKQEYKPSDYTLQMVEKLLKEKYSTVYQTFLLKNSDSQIAISDNQETARYFDVYRFFPGLYSNRFVSEYLTQIKNIKPIPDTTELKIRGAFSGAINKYKFLDWGRTLNDLVRLFFPDTVIFSRLNREEFDREAWVSSISESYEMVNRQHISKTASDIVFPLIREKNYKNLVLQYTYGAYYPYESQHLIDQNTKHYDSLIHITLLRNGILQESSQFAMALRYQKDLHISESVVDSLLYYSQYMAARRDSILLKDPHAGIDFGDFEAQHLNRLLTESQYTLLLGFKNRYQAINDALKDWADIEKAGIAKGLRKDDVVNEITNYYVNRYSAWNRLANDKFRQMANMRAIDDIKPPILKQLDAIRWNASTTDTKNNQKVAW